MEISTINNTQCLSNNYWASSPNAVIACYYTGKSALPVVRPPTSRKALDSRSREQTKKKSKTSNAPILATPMATRMAFVFLSRSVTKQDTFLKSSIKFADMSFYKRRKRSAIGKEPKGCKTVIFKEWIECVSRILF